MELDFENIEELCSGDHQHVQPFGCNVPDDKQTDSLAELFKVFGDATRIKILFVLEHGEMCVCDIAQAMKMTQPAISYQLKTLKHAKLVKSRREGKMIVYSLDDEHVHTIIGVALEHLKERRD